MLEENLKKCVEVAHDVTEQYRLYSQCDCDKKSMDDLIEVFHGYINDGKKITIDDLDITPPENAVVRGLMARTDSTYEIYIVPDKENKNRRFVTAKELFQTVLDEKEMWNMDLNEHVEELAAAGLFAEKPSPAVMAEMMAEIAAMEFLYPYKARIQDLKLIAKGTMTSKLISDHYGIPQIYVERYLSDTYMEHLRTSHISLMVAAE